MTKTAMRIKKRKTYPAYKPSGVEWLGKIPEYWNVKKTKHTTCVKGRIGWQGLKSGEFIDEGPYLVTGTDFLNGRHPGWGVIERDTDSGVGTALRTFRAAILRIAIGSGLRRAQTLTGPRAAGGGERDFVPDNRLFSGTSTKTREFSYVTMDRHLYTATVNGHGFNSKKPTRFVFDLTP